MPKIPLINPKGIEIIESILQDTPDTAEPTIPGPVRQVPANGNIARAKADVAANARVYGLATRKTPSKSPNTVIRIGVVGGYDLTNVPFDAPVYMDNDGDLSTDVGAVPVLIGRVIALKSNPFGTAKHKAIAVICPA